MESGEASLTPAAIQAIHPPEQASGRPERPGYTRAERSRPLPPDRLLLNSYLPPRGLTPPMEEVWLPGQKAPKRSSIAGGLLIGANPRQTTYTSCTRPYCRCPKLCGPRGEAKSMPSLSPLSLVKRTSYRWLKTRCWSATVTLRSQRNWYTCNCYVDRTRPGYPSRVPQVVPPSGVPLYNP